MSCPSNSWPKSARTDRKQSDEGEEPSRPRLLHEESSGRPRGRSTFRELWEVQHDQDKDSAPSGAADDTEEVVCGPGITASSRNCAKRCWAPGKRPPLKGDMKSYWFWHFRPVTASPFFDNSSYTLSLILSITNTKHLSRTHLPHLRYPESYSKNPRGSVFLVKIPPSPPPAAHFPWMYFLSLMLSKFMNHIKELWNDKWKNW